MKENAVTLLEVLIVIIIIAILAAIAVPAYTNRIERTRGERAIANIELIKDALRMYVVKRQVEPDYNLAAGQTDTLEHINTTLNMDHSDSFFNYNISNQTTFRRIEAIRNDGSSRWIRYNIDPVDGNPDQWDPAADASKWPWHP